MAAAVFRHPLVGSWHYANEDMSELSIEVQFSLCMCLLNTAMLAESEKSVHRQAHQRLTCVPLQGC